MPFLKPPVRTLQLEQCPGMQKPHKGFPHKTYRLLFQPHGDQLRNLAV
ncbi:hypothetical protein DB41_AE00200 [Neochlamydia sp. TUME1]|nr:hypothetical protein DB41_AE00200 [Neochlamydia sp. TUME1]